MTKSKIESKQVEGFVEGFLSAMLADIKERYDVPLLALRHIEPSRQIAREVAEAYLPIIEWNHAEQPGLVSLSQADLPRYGREAYLAHRDLIGIDYSDLQREYDKVTKPQDMGDSSVEDDMAELIELLDEQYEATRARY